MKITAITLRQPKENKGNLKAYADVVIENCLVIRNLKLIQTKEKIILCFPAKKVKESFKDIVHPITTDFREQITNEVVAKYNQLNN